METLTLDAFRERFPEFTEEAYPDEAVEYRLVIARAFFADSRWPGIAREHAVGLYAAHFLALLGSMKSGGDGSSGGASGGLVASKSVDGVSVSYDTGSSTVQGAGHWNQTAYGRELYMLIRAFGSGGVQI